VYSEIRSFFSKKTQGGIQSVHSEFHPLTFREFPRTVYSEFHELYSEFHEELLEFRVYGLWKAESTVRDIQRIEFVIFAGECL